MSKPQHTPGPVIARPEAESRERRITITGARSPVAIAEIVPTTTNGYDAVAEANGRLIKAAYNAFDSGARRLGCNAVELAERMAEGGLAELAICCNALLAHGGTDTINDRAVRVLKLVAGEIEAPLSAKARGDAI